MRVRFTCDPPKRALNLAKHGVDLLEAEWCDWSGALISASRPGPDGRARLKAVLFLRRDLMVAIFSPLGTEAVAIISLRRANRKERRIYAEHCT